MSSSRKHLSTDAPETALQCLITSRIDYCSTLLGGIAKNQIRRLQKMQNKAACLVLKTSRPNHVTPLLR
ncbi:hypothetical protein HOLleu_14637 [Holothuria leucospilota]|uniref:Uncharacterized protein n=1 Tax=Holothuria leucospilota TaxID=206669 RepID=A0A9Q1C991_HOLLE|nr:hypothetical protein HOLleu_14637 [Holothuria leucospilota]